MLIYIERFASLSNKEGVSGLLWHFVEWFLGKKSKKYKKIHVVGGYYKDKLRNLT